MGCASSYPSGFEVDPRDSSVSPRRGKAPPVPRGIPPPPPCDEPGDEGGGTGGPCLAGRPTLLTVTNTSPVGQGGATGDGESPRFSVGVAAVATTATAPTATSPIVTAVDRLALDAVAGASDLRARQQDKDNLAVALVKWLDVHVPDAKRRIGLCLLGAPVSAGAAAAPAGHASADGTVGTVPECAAGGAEGRYSVRVEAAGSGLLLIPSLPAHASTRVGALKRAIYQRLPTRPPAQQLLFAGHGGVRIRTATNDDDTAVLRDFGVGPAADDCRTLVLAVAPCRRVRPRPREGHRVHVGGLHDTNMDDLQAALRTEDPAPVMEALQLVPQSVPYWTWDPWSPYDENASRHPTRCVFLDGEQSPTSACESIWAYAERLRLPSLARLRAWAAGSHCAAAAGL